MVLVSMAAFPLQTHYASAFTDSAIKMQQCESLPLTGGTAVFVDGNGDGNICKIPSGASLNLSGPRASFLVSGIELLNNGQIIVSDSALLEIQNVILNNKGQVVLQNDATMLIDPLGILIQDPTSAIVIVDESSVIMNLGTLEGRGVYNNGTIYQYCSGAVESPTLVQGNQPINICTSLVGADGTANQATGQSMFSGGRTFYGERFESGASITNDLVYCVSVEMRKHGSPTGLAQVGFYDSNMNAVKKFGTINVGTLATGYKEYQFCLPIAWNENGHVITAGQILAVKYDGGDPINRIDVRRSNVGAGPDYDGLTSYHVNFDGSWHSYNTPGNSRDLLFKLTGLFNTIN